MATETKRGAKGKEKRGINASPSPSPSTSTVRRSSRPLSSSSNRSTPNSSGDHERPRTPTTEAKPVPNYLKPTISSIPKRATTDNAALSNQSSKPTLNRMRSFDRAPPSPQVQRAVKGSSNLGARDIRTTRSSSFSHKSTSSSTSSSVRPRPTSSDKVGARTTTKGGRLEPSCSRNLKKNTTLVSNNTTKRDPKLGGSSAKKPPKSVASEPCFNHGTNYETNSIGHHLDIDDHDMVNLDDDLQSLPEMSEMPEAGQELGDPTTLDKIEPVEESYDYKGDEVPPVEEEYEHKSEVPVQEILEHSHVDDDDQHDYNNTNDQEKSTVGNQPSEEHLKLEPRHQGEEDKHPGDQEIITKKELSFDHQQQQEQQGVGDQDGLVQEVRPIEKLYEEVPKLEVPEEIKVEEETQTPAPTPIPTPTKIEEIKEPTLKEEKQAEEKDKKQLAPITEENNEKSATPSTRENNEKSATPTTEEKNEKSSTPTAEEKNEKSATPTTEEKNEKPATPTEETKEQLAKPIAEEKNEKPTTPTPVTEEKIEKPTTEEKNEKPTTTATIAANKPTTGSSTGGKKENQQAYNDVIEETSKKLMGGKRRNKVLALAGAFETVISLENSGPSKK